MMKDGFSSNGKQRFRCGTCGKRSRHNPAQGHGEEFQEQVLRAFKEGMSMRGIARTFGISRNTLTKWLQKRPGDAEIEVKTGTEKQADSRTHTSFSESDTTPNPNK